MDYAAFTLASTLIHAIQGAALLALAFTGWLAFRRGGGRAELAGYAALLLAAAAGPAVIALLPGGRSLSGLSQALSYRSGFRLFVALSCLFGAAGLSGLMAWAGGDRAALWRRLYLFFLALAGAACLLLPWRVNPDAWSRSMAFHVPAGGLLLLAAAAEAGFLYFNRRPMRAAAFVLLGLCGVNLLSFREAESAYGPRMISVTAQPELPAVNNAAADKERPRN